jgi:hypothetical protein
MTNRGQTIRLLSVTTMMASETASSRLLLLPSLEAALLQLSPATYKVRTKNDEHTQIRARFTPNTGTGWRAALSARVCFSTKEVYDGVGVCPCAGARCPPPPARAAGAAVVPKPPREQEQLPNSRSLHQWTRSCSPSFSLRHRRQEPGSTELLRSCRRRSRPDGRGATTGSWERASHGVAMLDGTARSFGASGKRTAPRLLRVGERHQESAGRWGPRPASSVNRIATGTGHLGCTVSRTIKRHIGSSFRLCSIQALNADSVGERRRRQQQHRGTSAPSPTPCAQPSRTLSHGGPGDPGPPDPLLADGQTCEEDDGKTTCRRCERCSTGGGYGGTWRQHLVRSDVPAALCRPAAGQSLACTCSVGSRGIGAAWLSLVGRTRDEVGDGCLGSRLAHTNEDRAPATVFRPTIRPWYFFLVEGPTTGGSRWYSLAPCAGDRCAGLDENATSWRRQQQQHMHCMSSLHLRRSRPPCRRAARQIVIGHVSMYPDVSSRLGGA